LPHSLSPSSAASPVLVTVNSLGGLGDGIADIGDKPVFISKSCAGDKLEIRIVSETKENARGEIISVIEPGPGRAKPPCVYFSECGGCSLQHLSQTAYQNFKRKMAQDAITYSGFAKTKIETIFLPAATRRRVEFKWTGNSLAYYAARSHDMVPVENCVILHPKLEALMKPLAKALTKFSNIKTVGLTLADSGIELLLGLSDNHRPDKTAFEQLAASLKLSRVGIISENREYSTAVKNDPMFMNFGGYDVAFPPDAFLQACSEGQKLLTDAVLKGVGDAKHVVDLFSGIGTYSFPLSKQAVTHAVELDLPMVQSFKKNIKTLGLTERLSVEERDLFRKPLSAKELNRFDAIVINPPRIGAKEQTRQIAESTVKRVVMVSCNPATFARDAKTLKTAGFALAHAEAIDQFVYSPHLEIVAVFQRL
jgi:23S rRNA (uracil1939-C5)-methyltransferase